MSFFKNKYFLALAFIVSAFFLSISLGGEFLHDRVHQHATQKQHKDCPVYQLALQLIISAVIFAFASPVFSKRKISLVRDLLLLNVCCSFPSPRSPPASL